MLSIETVFAEIHQRYQATPCYLWQKLPDYAVFRHANRGKWFAVSMFVTADKLGLTTKQTLWIINSKASPELIEFLRNQAGIYPAYHMNKKHWLSLNMAEIEPSLFWQLLDESFQLTENKKSHPNTSGDF